MLIRLIFLGWAGAAAAWGAEVVLPARPVGAPAGSELARNISSLSLADREAEIIREFKRGNVPGFWRNFVPVKINESGHTLEYAVAPEYLALGSDEDYFLAPISPGGAQQIADLIGASLPTKKMVDQIYQAAVVKLEPTPLTPSAAMTTVAEFIRHNELVRAQRAETLAGHPLGELVAGHQKDVVLTPRLAGAPGKVAIYGWHRPGGQPIQPLYLGHTQSWVDYSHGARLVLQQVKLDGQPDRLDRLLRDPALSRLLSDEGPLTQIRYEAAEEEVSPFHERTETFHWEPGVRVVINSPALDTNLPVRLVLYALPNGNSIEQTVGRKIGPGEDWHFDIQHIGAQTRWLRREVPSVNWVVAYLECAEKSWPAWRRKNDPDKNLIPMFVQRLRDRWPGQHLEIVLTGHSGGGSFTFGYLDGVDAIATDVVRIAFLDSNYGYDQAQGHDRKLTEWIRSSESNYLCVLAYHDSVALLDGRTFVSESGGTWGRSHAMLTDWARMFSWQRETVNGLEQVTALNRRVEFLLKENPEKAVLHTRQVEWNGFIQAMVSGTTLEGKGYHYLGARAYDGLIAGPSK